MRLPRFRPRNDAELEQAASIERNVMRAPTLRDIEVLERWAGARGWSPTQVTRDILSWLASQIRRGRSRACVFWKNSPGRGPGVLSPRLSAPKKRSKSLILKGRRKSG